MVCCWTFTRC